MKISTEWCDDELYCGRTELRKNWKRASIASFGLVTCKCQACIPLFAWSSESQFNLPAGRWQNTQSETAFVGTGQGC